MWKGPKSCSLYCFVLTALGIFDLSLHYSFWGGLIYVFVWWTFKVVRAIKCVLIENGFFFRTVTHFLKYSAQTTVDSISYSHPSAYSEATQI